MSNSGKVLFIDSQHPRLQRDLEAAGFSCDMQYEWDKAKIAAELPNYIGIVIRSRIKLDKEIISKGTNLKFIARAGAGMENIDVAYAYTLGIHCLHAPEGNRDAVGEHAVGMLLSLFNNICKANNEVRNGIWIREGNRGVELQGKTVGIIGYGNMGSAFAKRLQGFGVTILAYDKYKKDFSDEYAKEASLVQIFQEADVLSIHVPLADETHYMINGAFIEKFRKSIYVINTARGKVVKTDDLVEYMKQGKILGACLDVLEYEALSFEGLSKDKLPEPFQYLIKSDKVVLTPHIAGWTYESHEKIVAILAQKILACVNH